MPAAQTMSLFLTLALAVVFVLVFLLILIVMIGTFRPWIRAFTSGMPISVLNIVGMRFRRIEVNVVVDALIMARQAGVAVSCRQMESAYLQGVDLEKLTLALIHAKKKGLEVTFDELVASDLEGRLADKLKHQDPSVSGIGRVRADGPIANETEDHCVRICRKCSQRVTGDSKICRNCGAIL